MIVYRNPLPEQMEEIYDLRWNILRDPSLPRDGTETDLYDSVKNTEHGALYQIQFGVQLVSTGRIHTPVEAPEVRRIRYMATREDMRGRGLGSMLLQEMERRVLAEEFAVRPIRIEANARLAVLGFYENLGYSAIGDEFELVGVPHIKIEKPVS